MKINGIYINPKNPRYIKDDRFRLLVKNIKEFPKMMKLRPIIIDDTGMIIGGNMRYLAIVDLGYKEIPEGWVKRAEDLTEEEKEKFKILDNVPFGNWDFDILANEWDLDNLKDWGVDLSEIETNIEAEEDDFDVDKAVGEAKEPICKEGNLWQLGEHRLLCGDSKKKEDVGKLMGGEKAVLLHADPPYGMGKEKDGVINDNLYKEKLDAFQMEWWKMYRPYIEDNGSVYIWGNAEDLWRLWYKGGLKDSERLTFRNEIIWDKGHGQGMESDRHRMYPTVSERCLFFMIGEQGFSINADNYWEGWDSIVKYLKQEKEKSGLSIKDFKKIAGHSETSGCHWFDKSQWTMPTEETYNLWKEYFRKKEYNVFKKEYDELKKEYDELKKEYYSTRAYFDNTHDNMTDVWQYERVIGEDRLGHATPKPVKMIMRIIKSSSDNNNSIIEPFGGTGTTLIACEQLNRKCYMMEIDPVYCDVIINRYGKYTGGKAVKIDGKS